MHRSGLRGFFVARLVLITALLATALPSPGAAAQEEELLRFEQREGEQVAFRFWVPVDAVKELFSKGISPAPPRRIPGFHMPPAGFSEGALILRSGSYSVEREGKRINLKRVLDGFLLIYAEAPKLAGSEGARTALLVRYYCGDDQLYDLMEGAGLPVQRLSGEFNSRLRADSQQLVEGKVSPAGGGEWRWRLVTTDLRHFEPDAPSLRLLYRTGSQWRALEIDYTDDFYMFAVGEPVFDGGSPLEAWQGWRWADDNRPLYQYNTDDPHRILSLNPAQPGSN
jgi:hypothetical protein